MSPKPKKSVLIVEDDLDIRECLRTILELDGYEVQEAGHGQQALELLQASDPGLILLDINMPVLTGGEFLARLPRTCLSPVLVMTAMAGLPPSGSCGFLRKPIDMDQLLEKVHTHCL